MGHRVLEACDELWLCGSRISTGMAMELKEAQKLGISVREISAEQIQGGISMNKKYGVWAMRSAGSVCGAAQSWCKQVIGLCLTAFLQSTILIAGLMVVKDHALLGLGLMLAAGEIPRIAGQFGLDTSTKSNLMGTVYAAQTAVNMTRTIVQAVAK